MARIARVVLPGHPHHVTQRGVRSMDIFYCEDDYRAYLQLLTEQGRRFGLQVVSYCLMTNHVHLVVIPSDETSLARAIGETHRLYTRMINFRQKTRGYLFQGRFFSTPLDEHHFFAAVRYVEQNPVRAKMVEQAWDYPYSSARYRVGIVEEEKVLSKYAPLDAITDGKEFLARTPEETGMIREKTRTGRPCGDAAFYRQVEEKTSLDLAPKKAGRPKKK
jgi:putative transposase